MLALLVVFLAPGLAYSLLRDEVQAFWLSAPVGMMALIANMIHSEVYAPDSDFDLVFGLACVLWAMVLAVAYAACLPAFIGSEEA